MKLVIKFVKWHILTVRTKIITTEKVLWRKANKVCKKLVQKA